MKLKPLGDRLIVKPVEEEETTASGLVLPETAKEKPQKGTVVAAGDGAIAEDGTRRPLDVAVQGDRIAGLGKFAADSARRVMDARRLVVRPGFLDAHVHIESAMVTPREFARAVVPREAVHAAGHGASGGGGNQAGTRLRYLCATLSAINHRQFYMTTGGPERPLQIEHADLSLIGHREDNQDRVAIADADGTVMLAVVDGMGGHAAGDVASRIIVAEIFADLTLRIADPDLSETDIPKLLRSAMNVANHRIRARIKAAPETAGMGGTVIVAVVLAGRLYWISVGDSPLLLYRDGRLTRLNDDHSMAPQIDLMVRKGLIDPEIGRNHPQRNCLTSALTGDEITVIDCPDRPFALQNGDLVLVASDGLQFLPDERLELVLARAAAEHSASIASALIAEVAALGDPCLLYTSPSPRDRTRSRMPSSA